MIEPNNYPQDLDQLLALAAAGDTLAFEHIYTETSGHVYPLVRRILKDSADSMQAVQDIYTRIWSHLTDYDPAQGTPQTWIMAIAHRMAIDRLRKSQSMTLTGTSEKAQSIHSALLQRPAYPAVLALAALTVIQSEAIYLAYFEGFTTIDIAAALGLDQNTTALNLRDGLHRATAWLHRATLT